MEKWTGISEKWQFEERVFSRLLSYRFASHLAAGAGVKALVGSWMQQCHAGCLLSTPAGLLAPILISPAGQRGPVSAAALPLQGFAPGFEAFCSSLLALQVFILSTPACCSLLTSQSFKRAASSCLCRQRVKHFGLRVASGGCQHPRLQGLRVG